jgi:5'-nucleotidase
MRILLTNDDGIAAEGLAVLARIARQLTDDVWIVAPEIEQSGASRALTLTEPVRVRKLDAKTFAVSGTPTDCVMLGLQELLPEPPDLVLSGVNRGQNMCEDVTFSGTVAGALQGMAMGVPAIALSQALTNFHKDRRVRFQVAEAYGAGVIARLLDGGWPDKVIVNVNFPDVEVEALAGVEVTVQGFRDMHPLHFEKRTDLRGGDYYWMGYRGRSFEPVAGTDAYAVSQGKISVTPLHIDLTHMATCHDLKKRLGGSAPHLKPRMTEGG